MSRYLHRVADRAWHDADQWLVDLDGVDLEALSSEDHALARALCSLAHELQELTAKHRRQRA